MAEPKVSARQFRGDSQGSRLGQAIDRVLNFRSRRIGFAQGQLLGPGGWNLRRFVWAAVVLFALATAGSTRASSPEIRHVGALPALPAIAPPPTPADHP